ncbi:MAG: hypothetical protein AB7R89_09530 [Dehalococcoidia bacterium]
MIELSRAGRVVAVVGAAAQLVGLGWDAVLHRLDPDLAAREGVFTLTNPGHVLFAGGLALVVVGIGMILIGGGSPRVVRYGSAAVLAVLSLGAFALAATGEGGLTGGHSHEAVVHVHEDGVEHTHDEHETFLQQQDTEAAPSAQSHDHGATPPGAAGTAGQSRHQDAPDIPITAADLTALQEQVAAARAATEQYQDVRLALTDGYVQVTQDLPGIAAHFINARHVLDGVFDPAKPEILLYARLDGQWTLVGLSYSSPFSGDGPPPEGFAGPLDAWHYHTNLCFGGQRVRSAGATAEQCRQAGGRFVQNTGWMAHLWLYLESPEGLFAHQNSLLKGSGAVLTRAEIENMP